MKHVSTNKTRHRVSTSVYSLTFRVRVMLPKQRKPCTNCKSAQHCTTRGIPYHSPKLHPGPCNSVGMRPRKDKDTYKHTNRHTQMRDHNTFHVIYDSCEM